ncbi:hypothetical protein P4U07_21830 [Bacillus mycoides]|uniref:hypothetical protein n=1 Tax=Bacillus mycoides TaxID=1405 RepID=UPI002E2509DD|nr:hypothetical protein [Bacillus mycoides]
MAMEYNHCEKRNQEVSNYDCPTSSFYADGILHFLRRLSPGTCIVLQYDSQRPTTATFQGFQNGAIILSDFDGFPGLAHLAIQKVNVISLGSLSGRYPRCHRECNCGEE